MTDGQCLTVGPEQHLLMRDQTAQPDAMDPDPVDLGTSSPRKFLDRCVRWLGEGSRGTRGRNPASGVRCGARWGIRLTGMVQLNDFGALVERSCLLSEAHHQHRSDGEVGRHQDTNVVMFGEAPTKPIQSLVGESRCADDRVDAVLDTPRNVVHHRIRVGEVDYHFRGFSWRAVISQIDCCNKLQVGGTLHGTADCGAHSATGSEHSDPGHPRPPF